MECAKKTFIVLKKFFSEIIVIRTVLSKICILIQIKIGSLFLYLLASFMMVLTIDFIAVYTYHTDNVFVLPLITTYRLKILDDGELSSYIEGGNGS